MKKTHTIAVVGGGVSGMTAALVLASFGHDVSLIESSPMLGLTIRGFYREGIYFDTGLHYTGGLGKDGILRRYLKFLGIDELPVVSFDAEGFDAIRFYNEGKEVRLPIGYEPMRSHLKSLFPNEEATIDAYFSEARQVFQSSILVNAELSIQTMFEEETRYDTLETFLAERTNDKLLAAVLSIHTLLHGSAPDEVSFSQHARVAASYFDSVHTFAGGGQALAKGFERQLAAKGVTVVLGKRVRSINFSAGDTGDRIEGVTLADGSMLDADVVVYTGHPHYLPDLVPQGLFKPAFVRRMRHLDDTPSAYMLFGVTDTPLFPGSARNFFLCPHTDLSSFFKHGGDVATGPYYVTTSPVTEKGYGVTALARGEYSDFLPWKDTVSGTRGPEYEAFKAAQLQRFSEGLLKACPELEGVRFIEGATPLTFRDYTNSPSGALYGCKHMLAQYNPQPVTRIPNLWLAGQSVVAPGILGAVISAFLVCGFIVGHEQLYKELGAWG